MFLVYESQRFFIGFLYFQYYVEFGGERYVDLGLGTHRVKCRVHYFDFIWQYTNVY